MIVKAFQYKAIILQQQDSSLQYDGPTELTPNICLSERLQNVDLDGHKYRNPPAQAATPGEGMSMADHSRWSNLASSGAAEESDSGRVMVDTGAAGAGAASPEWNPRVASINNLTEPSFSSSGFPTGRIDVESQRNMSVHHNVSVVSATSRDSATDPRTTSTSHEVMAPPQRLLVADSQAVSRRYNPSLHSRVLEDGDSSDITINENGARPSNTGHGGGASVTTDTGYSSQHGAAVGMTGGQTMNDIVSDATPSLGDSLPSTRETPPVISQPHIQPGTKD